MVRSLLGTDAVLRDHDVARDLGLAGQADGFGPPTVAPGDLGEGPGLARAGGGEVLGPVDHHQVTGAAGPLAAADGRPLQAVAAGGGHDRFTLGGQNLEARRLDPDAAPAHGVILIEGPIRWQTGAAWTTTWW